MIMAIEDRANDDRRNKNDRKPIAKSIFYEFIDGEADLSLRDGRVEHLRDPKLFARLKWLQAVNDLKGIRKKLPVAQVANINASRALLSVCGARDVQVVHIAVLVHMGADINVVTELNRTALHDLAESLQYACCEYLVECKASCDAVETTGSQTPLILACKTPLALQHTKQQLRTIDALLSSKLTSLDFVDCEGNTALDYAIATRKVLVVKRLLAAGASVMSSRWYTQHNNRAPGVDGSASGSTEDYLSGYLSADASDLRLAECIDYHASDNWLNLQRAYLSKQAMCSRLLIFRLREEYSATKRPGVTNIWDRPQQNSILLSTDVAKAADSAAATTAAEARQAHRRAHRESKNQARATKAQRAAEQEREQRKEMYLKRVEKEYHVSFKGLFA